MADSNSNVDDQEKRHDEVVPTDASDSDSPIVNEEPRECPSFRKLNPENEDGWDDLLGSGSIIKKVLKHGDGVRPDAGQEVFVRYSTRVLGSSTPVEAVDDVCFRVGDGDVVQTGMEIPLRLMKVGEHSLIRCEARYWDKDMEEKGVDLPDDANVEFEVEFLRLGKVRLNPEAMTVWDRVEAIGEKKVIGNGWYNKGNYRRAVMVYRKGLSFLKGWDKEEGDAEGEEEAEETAGAATSGDGDAPPPPPPPRVSRAEATAELCGVVVATANNLAAASHKTGNEEGVKEACMQVLGMDPDNVKALFRVGRYCIDNSDFVEATAALTRAVKLNPKDSLIRAEIRRLAEKKAEVKAREKELFRFPATSKKISSSSSVEAPSEMSTPTTGEAAAAAEAAATTTASTAAEEATTTDTTKSGAVAGSSATAEATTTAAAAAMPSTGGEEKGEQPRRRRGGDGQKQEQQKQNQQAQAEGRKEKGKQQEVQEQQEDRSEELGWRFKFVRSTTSALVCVGLIRLYLAFSQQ